MPLPNWAAAALLAREAASPVVPAITLNHRSWGAPIRLVRDTQDLISRGDRYTAAFFDLEVVTDTDAPPRATLTVPNVDQSIADMLLRLNSPPEVTIEVISLDHADEPVYRAGRLELRNVNITAVRATGDLVSRDYSTETCGTIRVIPARFPAFFRAR
jgi:hypothetical protein